MSTVSVMQEIQHVCENVPHFGFISRKTKFAENRDNILRHEDVSCTEAVHVT